MALTDTDVVALQVEKVDKTIPVLFDREVTWYSQLEKATDAQIISNREARLPLEIRPGGKFGHFDPAGGDLGRGGGSVYDKAVISCEFLKHAIEIQKKAEWGTDDSRKSVLNAVTDQVAKAMPEFRRHIDSLCKTGGDGVLGTITTVANAAGVDTYTLSTDGFRARLLRFGQNISVYNAALTTNRTSAAPERNITFHDLRNNQIKVVEVTGAIATDKIVVSGVSATPPVSIKGVSYHHNDASSGTWLGFDRSTTPEIRANRVNAAGSFLSLPFARLAVNVVGDRVGMDQMKFMEAWTHPAQCQAYEELGQLVINIDKQAKDENLNMFFGGSKQLAGATLKEDFSWDRTRIDFVNKKNWGRVEVKSPGFFEVGGKKYFELRGTSGGVAAAWIFYLVVGMNVFVRNPAGCVYVSDLAVVSGY